MYPNCGIEGHEAEVAELHRGSAKKNPEYFLQTFGNLWCLVLLYTLSMLFAVVTYG